MILLGDSRPWRHVPPWMRHDPFNYDVERWPSGRRQRFANSPWQFDVTPRKASKHPVITGDSTAHLSTVVYRPLPSITAGYRDLFPPNIPSWTVVFAGGFLTGCPS